MPPADPPEWDLTAGVPPVEPSADQRAGAKAIRGMFLAYVTEGFTERQALALLGHMLAAGSGGNT